MFPNQRISRGTEENQIDYNIMGQRLIQPMPAPILPAPVVQEQQKPITYLENNCTQIRSIAGRPIRPVQMRMDDVSTVDYTPCQQDHMNTVYKNYNFVRPIESTLPIKEYERKILDTIQLYNTTVIKGETGCGKSTQVPQFIMDNAARNNEYANIVITQPRKMAAIMLATRVAKERDWTKLCSYQVGLDNQTNPDTRITYMTTEVLVQKIIRKKSLSEYTHILLDEVHERDHHTDFALLVVKKLLHTTNDKAKVILMSATIDTTKFSRYFADPSDGYVIPAPVIEIHQVKEADYKIFYYDNIKQCISNAPDWIPPKDPELCLTMVKMCVTILKRFDRFENIEKVGDESMSELSSNRQGVLVFLPGLRQIELLNDNLRDSKDFMKWDIVPLHSSITRGEQNRALEPPRPGFRKIILTTNIAESSLTIHDVSYVIDFCLTKTLYCDIITNYTSLKLKWASKANCKQRAGRVGRTGPGRVYRLVTKGFFEMLEEYGTPELCRTPLSTSVLKVKTLDMGEPQALLALALDPPNLSDIHRTVLELKQVGALSVKSAGVATAVDGNLTFIGRVASSLPVDVRVSKLIVFGYMFGCFKQTIIIAAGLSLRNMFSRSFQNELQAHMTKISFAEKSQSDCIAILSAYELWMKYRAEGNRRWTRQKEKHWAEKQCLQLDVMFEMTKLVEELTRRLEAHGITHQKHLTIDDSAQLHLMLKMCIAASFFPYYFEELKHDVTDIAKHLQDFNPLTVALITNLPLKNSFLYEGQLRQLLRLCTDNLNFSFSGSRAVIHFPKEGRPDAGDIPNSVSLQMALKMKHIPRIQRHMNVRIVEKTKLKDKNLSINTQNVPIGLVPSPGTNGWRVFVTHVVDADHFWVANCGNECSKYNLTITNIENKINQHIPYCNPLDVNNVLNKTYCLAPMDEEASVYYRAHIESVGPCLPNRDRTALVFFLDYGNNREVSIKRLLSMPNELYEIPRLSIECKLCDVQPIMDRNKRNRNMWCQTAFEYTRKKLHYTFRDCQIYSIINNVVRTEIFVENELLSSILVKEGWGEKVSEPENSQMNHILRTMAPKGSPMMESIDARQSCKCDIGEKYDITLSNDTQIFRGPFSTLEMSFHGLSPAIGRYRVNVETNSVNSTALNLDYQSRHSKFIVASFVSLNHSDTKMLASDTTLMPSIPGLMQFCLLMFAPTVELRLSDDLTKYSGGIAGLGIENDELYKDEDIEFRFDFNFTNEELGLINNIRNSLNDCLNDLEEGNAYRLSTYQKALQKNLKKLIVQNRDYKKPEWFRQGLLWNCVPTDKILYAASEIPKEYSETYPLINAIKLDSQRSTEAVFRQVQGLFLFYQDLRIQKTQNYYEVNEHCILCDVQMNTYEELRRHMTNRDHENKENRALGCKK